MVSPSPAFSGLTDDVPVPADPSVAASGGDVVETVNAEWASYSTTGSQQFESSWQDWFKGTPPTNPNVGYFDAHVIWDGIDHHYIQVVDDYSGIYVAASASSNASGNWCFTRLPLDISSSQWADYPLVGVDSHAIWITYNVINKDKSAVLYPANLIAVSKSLESSSCPGSTINFVTSDGLGDPGTGLPEQQAYTVAPAVETAEAADGNEYMVDTYTLSSSACAASLFEVSLPDYPTFDTIDFPAGHAVQMRGGCYSQPPNMASQPGGAAAIETFDDRATTPTLMNGRLYFAFNTACDWGSGNLKVCVYAEVLDAVNAISAANAIYGNANAWWWFPSFAPEPNGNGTVASSFTDGTISPDAVVVGITSTGGVDGASVFGSGSTTPYTEGGALTNNACPQATGDFGSCYRWGDFSTAAVDPTSGKTWSVAQTADASGGSWLTSIVEASE